MRSASHSLAPPRPLLWAFLGLAWAVFAPPRALLADLVPGKPTHSGRRVLILYSPNGANGAFGAGAVDGGSGLDNFLRSAGAYAADADAYNFTVEKVAVPAGLNTAATEATGVSAAAYASLPLTAANYCLVFDMRFRNLNVAGGAANNEISYDSLVAADRTAYGAYLASGGGLFILGENYYDPTGVTVEGFTSRMSWMNKMMDLVASSPTSGPTTFRVFPNSVGGGIDTLQPEGANSYLLESDPMAPTNFVAEYSGFMPAGTYGSGKPWIKHTYDPSWKVGLAWEGADLAAPYNAGRLAYFGDVSSAQAWGTNSRPQMKWLWANAVDFLFRDTCCTAPSTLCGAGPEVQDPADHPVISCFNGSANGWTGGAYSTLFNSSGGGGGSLRYDNGGGAWWSNYYIFARTFTTGDLVFYDQICFTLRNETNQPMTFEVWNQSFDGDITANFGPVASMSTYSACLPFSGPYGSANELRFRNVTAGGQTGVVYLDDVQLRHSCGTQPIVRDGACCTATTPTYTPTRTPTPSPSPTPSFSPTRTATPSASHTPTASHTPSSSATPSPSSTPTATPSATPTPTSTPTVSDTNTPGPSPTDTVTLTASPSSTETPTFTASATGTPTSTSSPSPSATPSATPSSSSTPTATETALVSPTSTATPSASSTITLTASSTASSSATPTLSSTPSITFTSTPSPTSTATPTASSTRTATDTSTATPTASATPSITETPTASATWTASPTASPTPFPVPFRLVVGLYNAAGERVRQLFDASASEQPLDLGLTQDAVLPGSLGTVLLVGGSLRLPWDGLDDQGQAVSGGTYYFKAEFADPYGAVTALVKPVQVLAAPGPARLEVFNSAGELVYARSLGLSVTTAVDLAISRSGELGFEYDPATGAALDPALITVRDQGGASQVYAWDGRDQRGRPVASGSYLIQVTSTTPGGRESVLSKPVAVVAAPRDPWAGGPLALAPNPARGKAEVVLVYPLAPGLWGALRLYDLAGELVAEAADLRRSGRIVVRTASLASGVYIAEVQQRSGSSIHSRRFLRLALVK